MELERHWQGRSLLGGKKTSISEECMTDGKKAEVISAVLWYKAKPYQQGGTRCESSTADPTAGGVRAEQQRGFKAPLLNLAGELRLREMKLWTGEWLQMPESHLHSSKAT